MEFLETFLEIVGQAIDIHIQPFTPSFEYSFSSKSQLFDSIHRHVGNEPVTQVDALLTLFCYQSPWV